MKNKWDITPTKILNIITIVITLSVFLYILRPTILEMFPAYRNRGKEVVEEEKPQKTKKVKILGYTEDVSEYNKMLESTPSDIEGLSQMEKYNMGLQVADGSDTDSDGLTDKEEIEVYKTDPTKMSTAGDLYTDGYKVENGLDPLVAIEAPEKVTFNNNSCNEVTLEASRIENLDAYITETDPSLYTIKNAKILKAYDAYGYIGNMSIDVSDIAEANGIKANKLKAYVGDYGGVDIHKAKSSVKDNIMTVDVDMDEAIVFITKSDIRIFYDKNNANETGLRDLNGTETPAGDGAVWGSPILAFFWGKKPAIYYVSSGDEATDAKIKDTLIEQADNMTDGKMLRYPGGSLITHKDYVFSHADCKEVSQTKLDLIKNNFLLKLPESLHFTRNGKGGGNILLDYFLYSDFSGIKRDSVVEGYDYHFDELPFGNFSTVEEGGLCTGFVHVTAMVHNDGGIPLTGSYASEDGKVSTSWDLTTDPENATFADPGLSNYKDYNFVKDHLDKDGYIDRATLTDGENQFVNMMIGYWAEGNDYVKLRPYLKSNLHKEKYDYRLVELMKEYLDTGKMLEAGFSVREDENGNLHGHSLNIISYTESTDNPDVTFFKMYDCNFPGSTNFKNGVTLIVRKHGDTFSYHYSADGYSDYITSSSSVNDKYSMVVYDEHYNILNDMID